MKIKVLEWFGVITAIIYSMMVALNIGLNLLDFFYFLFQPYQLATGHTLVNIVESSFSNFSMPQLGLLAWLDGIKFYTTYRFCISLPLALKKMIHHLRLKLIHLLPQRHPEFGPDFHLIKFFRFGVIHPH